MPEHSEEIYYVSHLRRRGISMDGLHPGLEIKPPDRQCSSQLLSQLLRTDNQRCYLPLPLILKTLSTAVELPPSDVAQ